MAVVLIVSRTQMKNGVCVGGINESTLELIRLHNERGGNLSIDAPFEIGDRWDLEIETAWNRRPVPHTEDKQIKIIHKIENVGESGIVEFLDKHNLGCCFVEGCLQDTFNGYLILNGKNNYIAEPNVPQFSTQFWRNDKDLVHREMYGKHYYCYGDVCIKYVGFQEHVERIPSGSIIRLSLANWWRPEGCDDERCYLQLSGWYDKNSAKPIMYFNQMSERTIKEYAKETLTIAQFKSRFQVDSVEVIRGNKELYIKFGENVGYISASLQQELINNQKTGELFFSHIQYDNKDAWILHSEFTKDEIESIKNRSNSIDECELPF